MPTVEAFVRECRLLPRSEDIMSIKTVSQASRFQELLEKLPRWREERLPGARATRSTYDRAASTILKWLYLALHDVPAVSTYAYVLPFIVSLPLLNNRVDSSTPL